MPAGRPCQAGAGLLGLFTNLHFELSRSLSIYILVNYRVPENYSIKFSKMCYYWLLSMQTFRFGETYLPHIKLWRDIIMRMIFIAVLTE